MKCSPTECPEFPGGAPLAVPLVFLGHRVAHLIERRLAHLDYNHTQAAILGILAHHPGLMAQNLAAARVEPPSVTRALRALERRGLVLREPRPTEFPVFMLGMMSAGLARAGASAKRIFEVINAQSRG